MNRIKLAIITCLMMLSLPLFAQKVTLNEKNSRLKDVLEKIVEQTNYDLFYSTEILKKSKRVRIKVTDQDLRTVLDEIFHHQTISYSIANNTIVLVPKRPRIVETVIEVNIDQLTRPNLPRMVEGEIRDQAGKPIRGVTIVNNKDPKNSRTISDINGRFNIETSRGDLVTFSCQGYKESTILFRGERNMLVTLYNQVLAVNEVTVEARVKKNLNLNTQIDMTNRSYMNLGQLLQGTVPGLTLQVLPSNKRKIVGITEIGTIQSGQGGGLRKTYYTLDQFLQKFYPNGQRMIDAIENKTSLPGGGDAGRFFIEYSNQASVTLVPELRGSASFGNTEGMMVIIDGFPVEEFPADYPMANVESVEVIKDPKELIKWGPRATAGIILIKTKTGRKNQVNITYNANMYFKPAPKYDMAKLGLASSADIIDYLKSAATMDLVPGDGDFENLNLAERLFAWRRDNKITEAEFNRRIDSLSILSNEAQVAHLQQNVMSQNHLLSFSGGTPQYMFTLTGTYNNFKSHGLNNNSNTYGVDLKNNFNLLKGKLIANWQINANRTNAQGGANELSIYNLPPAYQMFLDRQGNYIYDQKVLGEVYNNLIMKNGYFNHGINMLEDSRLMNSLSKNTLVQSRLEMKWDLFKGLRWDNSVFYRMTRNNNDRITDRQSSEGRQLFNNYGSPNFGSVDFYVPPGDILNNSQDKYLQWNIRSGLSYSLKIDEHTVTANIGAGGANETRERPGNVTRYGYNKNTGKGSAIFLPAGDKNQGVENFRRLYSSTAALIYPFALLTPSSGDTSIFRNLNWNAGINYDYKEKTINFNANYSEAFSPNYGKEKFATTRTFNSIVGYQFKHKNLPDWLSGVMVSAGLMGNKMPDLPTTIGSNRYRQAEWNNYAIWVNNFIPVPQAGQSSFNIFEELRLNLFGGDLSVYGRYNTMKLSGISPSGSLTDSASFNQRRTLRYFSAGLEGSLRDGTLMFNGTFDRSPEGQKQFNGNISYDIKKESFFTSEGISTLMIGATYQDLSSIQGLGLMMGTNSSAGGGFGLATNSTFSVLPPRNKNIEIYFQFGLNNDRHRIDLRYYNRSDQGITNNIPIPTDPSTGLDNQITFSNIVNKGVEFFYKSDIVRKPKFSYSFAINGAYNLNMAKKIPKTPYSASRQFLTAFREGYSTTNVWGYRWAGLNAEGAPQIYDAKGNITANPDSSVLANDIIYMGATRAPWTGGFMHDITYGKFFARVSFMGSFGGIMRRFIPANSGAQYENSNLISQRWKKPGDEAFTDVPALTNDTGLSIRSFLAQNSSNSFMSANFIRLQEVMVGWVIPKSFLNEKYVKSLRISAHMQNVAVWAKNRYKYDPNNVDTGGRLGLPTPIQYGATLNVIF